VVDYITVPISSNTLHQWLHDYQGACVPYDLLEHCMCVLDYGLGCTPRPVYIDSEESLFDLHFCIPHRDTSWKLHLNHGTAPRR